MLTLRAGQALRYVQRMSTALAKDLSRRDTTFYPVEDDMGEEMNHREIADLLRALLKLLFSLQGKVARVGANQFIYWVQGNPQKTLAPDIYVLPGVDPETGFGCWKVWETGIVPSFALEVVSQSIEKDYVDAIERYRELGTSEVIIFDPRAVRASSRRVHWQVYHREEGRGVRSPQTTRLPGLPAGHRGCRRLSDLGLLRAGQRSRPS